MAYDFPNAPTIGQVANGYTWDGEKWVSLSGPNVSNQSGVIGITIFTSSGTYVPSSAMTTCVIECVGGGGGGGGCTGAATKIFSGAGGGSGSYSRADATAASIGASQAITIGAGGNGGATGNNNGANGLDTSVGALVIAKGGGGGKYGAAGQQPVAGLGGIVGTGDIATAGTPGLPGFFNNLNVTISSPSGAGGSSVFGGGAPGVASLTAGVNGVAASNYGSGGSGGVSANTVATAAGGNGSAGLVVITEYGMTALTGTATGAVRYDLAQGLTANQMAQARSNINVTKKNYIINGGMQISQENGATAASTNLYYPADQWIIFQAQGGTLSCGQIASLTPAGSPNRIQLYAAAADTTVGATDQAGIATYLEGLRVADLKFGTAAARMITIQFGVKAPAGTYCVVVFAAQGALRTYVAEYVIAAGEANTDVVKSVTVPGDVSGTWPTSNTGTMYVQWSLMAGSSVQQAAGSWQTAAGSIYGSANQFNFMGTTGNTFELFDVSLTEGNVAPPFQVPDYATELAACQRYWQKSYFANIAPGSAVGPAAGGELFGGGFGNMISGTVRLFSKMRTYPTVIVYDNAGTSGLIGYYVPGTGWLNGGGISQATPSEGAFYFYMVVPAGTVQVSFDWTASARM